MISRSRAPLSVSLLAALLLSACGTGAPAVTEPAVIPVARAEQRLPLAVDASGALRKPGGDLPAFLVQWRDQGWGPLTIEAPGLSQAARARLLADLARQARRTGADAAAVALAPAGAGGYGVWLRFDRAVALPPDCGPEIRSFNQAANNPTPAFGCATRRNLGAMIANPADLVEPRLDDGVNAARGAAVIETYRKGTSAASAAAGASAGNLSSMGAGTQP